jgi:hypothetical protein
MAGLPDGKVIEIIRQQGLQAANSANSSVQQAMKGAAA